MLTVDPGRRAYVRHVNITGNTRTRDDVIRREVRQYESAWFDSEKVKISRDRIDRLGYFDSVTAEPKPVEGTRDQVDLEINVKERTDGLHFAWCRLLHIRRRDSVGWLCAGQRVRFGQVLQC